jgi:hypothetical protein
MTSVSTYSVIITRVHTAVHLTDVILGTIGDILADLGVVTSGFTRDWEMNERAIKTWIMEGSLAQVILECHQPSKTIAGHRVPRRLLDCRRRQH